MRPNLYGIPIIEKLFRYGHFHNPAMPTPVQEHDLPYLNVRDQVVQIALASYQEYFLPQLNELSFRHHKRAAVCDGKMGPATMELLARPRCAVPDFGVLTGSGSWNVGCHPEYPKDHAFKVRFDKSEMPGFLGRKDDPNSIMEQAWAACAAAYANIGIVFFRDDNTSRPDTLASFTRGAGWIGLAIVPRDPDCSTSIWAKYDYGYSPSNLLNQWAMLFAHEFGHNMGLSHSRGGVMNPSIISSQFTPTIWRNDPSFSFLERWFGGEPVDQPEPDPPGPEPEPPGPSPPSSVWIRGSVTVMDGNKELGEFHFVPKEEL